MYMIMQDFNEIWGRRRKNLPKNQNMTLCICSLPEMHNHYRDQEKVNIIKSVRSWFSFFGFLHKINTKPDKTTDNFVEFTPRNTHTFARARARAQTHTHTHTSKRAHTHTQQACTHIHSRTRTQAYTHTRTQRHTHTHMHALKRASRDQFSPTYIAIQSHTHNTIITMTVS